MKLKRLTQCFVYLLSIALIIPPIHAAPADNPGRKFVRTVENSEGTTLQLSRNLYRTESYQANYTVEVPYQERETYYIEVPYQETEHYTEIEEYTDWENVCRDHIRYEKVCKVVHKCVPKTERRCEIKKICQTNFVNEVYSAIINSVLPSAHAENILTPKKKALKNSGTQPMGTTPTTFGNDDDRNREEERRQREQERQQREQERQQREQEQQRREEERRQRDQEREQREREQQRREEERRQREQDRQQREQEREQREREQQRREEERRQREQDRERREREQQERERERQRREEERRRREEEERRERCHKRVCEDVIVGEICEDKRVCKDVPRNERICKFEWVRKTRPVNKTRLVTKYRTEARYRLVTKYRTETRCCVTKERQVFDRQYVANVKLQFPTQAILEPGESEQFEIVLAGSDNTASIEVTPIETIFSYNPRVSRVGSNQFLAEINVVPTYNSGDLGADKMSKPRLTLFKAKPQLSFEDLGIVKKVNTSYKLFLLDATTGSSLGSFIKEDVNSPNVRWDIDAELTPGQRVLAQIQVNRVGAVLAEPIQFTSETSLEVEDEPKYDPAPYMDKSQVGKFSIEGRQQAVTIFFRDLTADIPAVQTSYVFRLSMIERAGPRILAEKTFSRSELRVNPDGKIPLNLASAFEVQIQDLMLLKKGTNLTIEGEVQRFGSLFPSEPFAIPKKVTLTIK